MNTVFTNEEQKTILQLFFKNRTVAEIAADVNLDQKAILYFLTARGLWSTYCSDCTIKRCFDCRGLSQLGEPVSAQDMIDMLAQLKGKR